jgi:undecaprenyl-diphosphatase
MSVLSAIVLGAVQGLTEFLPISSSAHLILLPRFLRWPVPGLAFDVAMHLGTLAAVIVYFRADLALWVRAFLQPGDATRAPARRLVGLLLLATIPGALAGLVLEHHAESTFRSPALIAATLAGMGLLMAWADRRFAGAGTVETVGWRMALLLGTAQALAIVPGISRSGVTITTALFLGLRRPDAARFSFLMSMPIIAGAGVLKLPEILRTPEPAAVALGFLSAAATGFFAIWFLLRHVQTRGYTPFVIYRLLLAGLILWQAGRFA